MGMDLSKIKRAERVFGKVLSEVKPSKVEMNATTASINTVMHRLRNIVDKGVELKVVGSIARETNLKGDSDVDIFVLFQKKTDSGELVRKGLAYGKALANGKRDRYEIKYAEHPYVRLYLDELDVRIDLVPALKIDSIEEMGTTVDRTPLHADFINANLSGKQRDDARVLKQLLKAHHIYGAEVKVGGFPGYLCEILVYHYGSLLKLLDNASQFTLPIILDPKTKGRLSDNAIAKRFNSKFVVIDPVDPNRNVAAGVSLESLSRFILVSRAFVKDPSIKCFYGYGFSALSAASISSKFIKESGFAFYLISTKVPDKTEDILWPQLRKVANMIIEMASRYDYGIHMAIPWISGSYGNILLIAPEHSPRTRLIRGPEVFMREASENFLKQHKDNIGMVLRDSSIYVIEKNKYKDIEAFLRDAIKDGKVGKHKDIRLNGAKLFVNKIPKRLSESACSEILKKITL